MRKRAPLGARPSVEALGPGVVRLTSRAGKTRVVLFVTRWTPVGWGITATHVERREFLDDVDGVDLEHATTRVQAGSKVPSEP